jgi:hypothetical protein
MGLYLSWTDFKVMKNIFKFIYLALSTSFVDF